MLITDIDRLGRNADDVMIELKTLKSKKIKVVALDVPHMNELNTINDNSLYDMIIDIVITLKAHMAQQEREKTVSRINQGLLVAREKGTVLGRPKISLPKDFIKEYNKFKNGDYGKISAKGFAKMLGIVRSTLYKYIKIYEKM
ncbi:recombinase family protein [Clostridium sp. UBA1652]|uniref:recombinase family protein n=1 Tax=Clostridium sp. UBA1652 TaxID=1946348 RepID=UPI0032E41D76